MFRGNTKELLAGPRIQNPFGITIVPCDDIPDDHLLLVNPELFKLLCHYENPEDAYAEWNRMHREKVDSMLKSAAFIFKGVGQ